MFGKYQSFHLIKGDFIWCGLTLIQIRAYYFIKQLTQEDVHVLHWSSLMYSDDMNVESDSNEERHKSTPILICISSVLIPFCPL